MSEMQHARDAIQAGQQGRARNVLNRLVASDETNGEAWHLLAQIAVDPDQRKVYQQKATDAGYYIPGQTPLPPVTQAPTPDVSDTQAQKMQVVKQIGEYESRLAVCEGAIRTHERELASAKGSRTTGTVIFIIGLFMPFLWWPAALLFIIVGAVVALDAGSKMRKATSAVASMESQIVTIRQKLAELRAQMMMF